MITDEITQAYFGAFPQDFHADLIRLIASKCKSAVDECSVYRKERASNLAPYVRRTQIEENVELLVDDYPQIDCFVRTLGTNNCVTELRREVVLLTIHKVAKSSSKVRPAVQREMLARSSQTNFLEPQTMLPDHAILYAQLKYGTARRFPTRLAFAIVDFPDKDGNIVHSINLLAMPEFKSLLDDPKQETKTEDIKDNLGLNLRSDARDKNRRSGTGDTRHDSQLENNNSEDKTDEDEDNKGDKGGE